MKNRNEVEAAVNAGKTVCWKNSRYTVVKDRLGRWSIVCDHGHPNANCGGMSDSYFGDGSRGFSAADFYVKA